MEPIEMIGLAKSNSVEGNNALDTWINVCSSSQQRLEEWRETLRLAGVKAAHPNDGWIDREKNIVHFVNPYFNDNALEGDLVCIGSYCDEPDKWRFVRLTEKVKSRYAEKFKFEDCESPFKQPKISIWQQIKQKILDTLKQAS